MSCKAHLVLAAVFSFAVPCAQAADTHVSGQELLSLCTANMGGLGDRTKALACMGFVVGVANTFDCVEDNHGYLWDSYADASQPELVAVVVDYIQRHPAARVGEGHRAIGAALQEAFPCQSATVSN